MTHLHVTEQCKRKVQFLMPQCAANEMHSNRFFFIYLCTKYDKSHVIPKGNWSEKKRAK